MEEPFRAPEDKSGAFLPSVFIKSVFWDIKKTNIENTERDILSDKQNRDRKGNGFMKKWMWFSFVTTGLILMIAFFSVKTVQCISEDDRHVKETYYRQEEKEFRAGVRRYLEEKGYSCSGVTMTRTEDGGGNRTYRVLIHHDAISCLTEPEQEKMKMEMREKISGLRECGIRYEFFNGGL